METRGLNANGTAVYIPMTGLEENGSTVIVNRQRSKGGQTDHAAGRHARPTASGPLQSEAAAAA
ncbi:hypothetical protein OUZ56_008281 [Daphnia magna]|uniref:Uncharacterized protein n=1 Tax=Daphnia magna TaxID=35525 RepID=A0ABR0ACH8_9CRUS|nr:hypothetical protein OUZ56_008281 [Daphnia magna]